MTVYFHGLESSVTKEKYKILKDMYGDVYAPQMNYRQPNLFNDIYEQLKNQKVTLIAGSSMGGYFAYWMAKKLGVKTAILFNPALAERTIRVDVDETSSSKPMYHVVLGEADDVVLPEVTREWLTKNEKRYKIYTEKYGHRTPVSAFRKYFKKLG